MSSADAGNSRQVQVSPGPSNSARQGSHLVVVAIDDDPAILGFYLATLSGLGIKLESSPDPSKALDLIAAHDPSLVILDLTMPDVNGMELLSRIRERDPQARVVMVTGTYSIETAVKAIQQGAIDYICKPISVERLRELVERVRNMVEQEERAVALELELAEVCNFEGMIGRSPRMREVFDLIRRAAPHFRIALVLGETGTGKEMVARALHNLSPRRHRRFAVCNCAALPDTLAESELFGHRKGAFTGATEHKVGFFEWTNGGTIFMDEIGELSPAIQSKLLRVLQTGEIQKLGAPEPQTVDTLVVAATSRDLREEASSGAFRADLWYRISMVQIQLPPLREHREDILLLARHFLQGFSSQYGKEIRKISRRAESALLAYAWPGNVRELENVVGRGCMLTRSRMLDLEDLPEEVRNPFAGVSALHATMEDAEKQALIHALGETKNKALAARKLGISRARLYRLMEKFGLADEAAGEKSLEPGRE